MRGHELGVRDIGEVSGGIRKKRIATVDDDGRRARREYEPGMVDGDSKLEHLKSIQSCRDRLGICDRAWCGAGSCASHGQGSDGTHGMRGYGLGVGDVGAV